MRIIDLINKKLQHPRYLEGWVGVALVMNNVRGCSDFDVKGMYVARALDMVNSIDDAVSGVKGGVWGDVTHETRMYEHLGDFETYRNYSAVDIVPSALCSSDILRGYAGDPVFVAMQATRFLKPSLDSWCESFVCSMPEYPGREVIDLEQLYLTDFTSVADRFSDASLTNVSQMLAKKKLRTYLPLDEIARNLGCLSSYDHLHQGVYAKWRAYTAARCVIAILLSNVDVGDTEASDESED